MFALTNSKALGMALIIAADYMRGTFGCGNLVENASF